VRFARFKTERVPRIDYELKLSNRRKNDPEVRGHTKGPLAMAQQVV
jgi:hypothetical protein